MITKSEIKSTLEQTNPGLTNQELNELSDAIYSLTEENCSDGIALPTDMVESCLEAVTKLKSTFENIQPQGIEDVVLVNELKQLEWKLKEELRKV